MEELGKISSRQLYNYWKNLSMGLLSVAMLIAFSAIVPFYISPILALFVAAALYTVIYNHKLKRSTTCLLLLYSILSSLIVYSFVTILINILYVWQVVEVPHEFLFLTDPYIPSLILCPVCFLTILIIYLRRKRLKICKECRIQNGASYERGKMGNLLTRESHLQLKNLIYLFGFLTAITWIYYLYFYIDTNVNHRDWYVFVWLVVIAFVIDELYFMSRYYNLYLDLKESDEILSQEELMDMTVKTYIRFYVVCNEMVLINHFPSDKESTLVDTPIVSQKSVNGITAPEVAGIIKNITRVNDGELRFFFGRKLQHINNQSLLRYFYFLKGTPDDYPDLESMGVWLSFADLKVIYSEKPYLMSPIFVGDITRMATIVLTQKLFDKRGYRKNKVKSYRPTFSLKEVRDGSYDFQDDKWIKISVYNSDSKLYRLKMWFNHLLSRGGDDTSDEDEWL